MWNLNFLSYMQQESGCFTGERPCLQPPLCEVCQRIMTRNRSRHPVQIQVLITISANYCQCQPVISPLTYMYKIFIVISKNNLTQNCVRFECRLPCTCIVEYLVDYIYTTLILLVMGFSVILIPSSAALLYYYTGVPVIFVYLYHVNQLINTCI